MIPHVTFGFPQDAPPEEAGGLWHQRRGKIVRSDFIQTIADGGHWIQKELERNSLAYWDGLSKYLESSVSKLFDIDIYRYSKAKDQELV